MPLLPNIEPRDYLAIVIRRKWAIVFPFLLILYGAIVYCVIVPEQFRSSTTIMIIPQRVPESYIRSSVSLRIEDRMATIQQLVMSRTRLSIVMEELGLYRDQQGKVPIEILVEEMRKHIEVGIRGKDTFTVSFSSNHPQTAMMVTSRLASFFIDENLKTREQQAVGTSEFLDSQLKETKVKLESAEEKVRQYKMRYMGELPQQVETNLVILRQYQDQYKANSDAIRSAEDRKSFLEARISMIESSMLSAPTRGTEVGEPDTSATTGTIRPRQPAGSEAALAEELAARRRDLADLSRRYTEQYPQVRQARKDVERLEKQLHSARNATSHAAPSSSPSGAISLPQDQMLGLKSQVKAIDLEIAALKVEGKEIQKYIAASQSKVEQAPRREQEMIGLNRDYDNLRRLYDELMRKKLDAEISQNLEMRQKGEQFHILDPANVPQLPFKPDRKMILSFGFLAAIAVGFGCAFGLEFRDPTIRGVKEFKLLFSLPVLATFPVLQDSSYLRRQRWLKAFILGGLMSLTTAFAVFLVAHGEKVRAILQETRYW